MEDFICTYPDCGKVCKSKGGLRIHQVRMHEKQRKTFTCSKCNSTFASESSWKNHEKRCMVERAEDPSRARCGTCGKDVSKNNIARHRRTCEARAGIAGRREEAREARGGQDAAQGANPLAPRVYRAERGEGSNCGRMLAKTNMARHQRTCGGWQ